MDKQSTWQSIASFLHGLKIAELNIAPRQNKEPGTMESKKIPPWEKETSMETHHFLEGSIPRCNMGLECLPRLTINLSQMWINIAVP